MSADKLGPTGKFPRGKIHESDEGETTLAVGHNDGAVIIDFGAPIAWIGFPPDRAVAFAKLIMQHANEAARHGGTQ